MGADPFASRGADSCPAWREVVCAALVDIAVDGEIALGGGFGMAGAGCGSWRSDAAWALVAVLFPAVLGTPELGALAGGGGGWVVGVEAAAGLGGAEYVGGKKESERWGKKREKGEEGRGAVGRWWTRFVGKIWALWNSQLDAPFPRRDVTPRAAQRDFPANVPVSSGERIHYSPIIDDSTIC